MSAPADLGRHPANDLPLRVTSTCGQCRHYERVLSRCMVSRDEPTVGPDWAACVRFLPHGLLGRVLGFLARHPLPFALAGVFAVLGYPVSLVLR